MKKMLIVAMVVGMLLIGAASAVTVVIPGIAKANADAYAKGHAVVDLNPWTDATAISQFTDAKGNTYAFVSAKLDPVSWSLSDGQAVSQMTGTLTETNVNGPKQTIGVTLDQAVSKAMAFNYAEGSLKAEGATCTENIAKTSVSDDKISSLSIADSASEGFALGFVGTPNAQSPALPAVPLIP